MRARGRERGSEAKYLLGEKMQNSLLKVNESVADFWGVAVWQRPYRASSAASSSEAHKAISTMHTIRPSDALNSIEFAPGQAERIEFKATIVSGSSNNNNNNNKRTSLSGILSFLRPNVERPRVGLENNS